MMFIYMRVAWVVGGVGHTLHGGVAQSVQRAACVCRGARGGQAGRRLAGGVAPLGRGRTGAIRSIGKITGQVESWYYE